MAECEWIQACPFLANRHILIEAMREIYLGKYCQHEFHKCARYLVFKSLGPDKVPLNLFPNQRDRAQKTIDAAG